MFGGLPILSATHRRVEVMMLSAIQSRAAVLTEMGLTEMGLTAIGLTPTGLRAMGPTAMGRARVGNETRRADDVMGGATCDRC
jgi:hypothetical protein